MKKRYLLLVPFCFLLSFSSLFAQAKRTRAKADGPISAVFKAPKLIVFNTTKINFETPFEKESYTAIITALAGGCAILLFTIWRVVVKIDRTVKEKS